MPKLEITEAEALLLAYVQDSCDPMEKEVQRLLTEIRQQRSFALKVVFDSHKEPPPDFSTVKFQRDPKGKITALEWEKAKEAPK